MTLPTLKKRCPSLLLPEVWAGSYVFSQVPRKYWNSLSMAFFFFFFSHDAWLWGSWSCKVSPSPYVFPFNWEKQTLQGDSVHLLIKRQKPCWSIKGGASQPCVYSVLVALWLKDLESFINLTCKNPKVSQQSCSEADPGKGFYHSHWGFCQMTFYNRLPLAKAIFLQTKSWEVS